MRLGQYAVRVHNHGFFRLDGGAMFGSVPKTLWSKEAPADEANRILLATRSLLLEGDGRKVLVDVGCGDKWNEKTRAIFAIEGGVYEPIDGVTDVILTHLHFDHAGGVSRWNEEGRAVPNYPGARHFVSRENLENAKRPHLRERASYLAENVEPLQELELVLTEDGQEFLPGVTVFQSHGHTRGLQWVKVQGDGQTIVFPADLVPTSKHIPVPYVMGYDMCAERAMEEKAAFLARAAAEGWIVVFEHDPEVAAGRIGMDERGRAFLLERVELVEG